MLFAESEGYLKHMPARPPSLRGRSVVKPRKASNWTRTVSRHKRGYDSAYDRMRARVLEEEPICRPCDAQGLVTASVTADHIVPLAEGGTGDRGNMQGICAACHRAKTAREAARARKRRAGR